MLSVCGSNRVKNLRHDLKSLFAPQVVEVLRRRLSTPGGPIPDASLMWRKDVGLWAYFHPEPFKGRRWPCWYGTDPGKTGKTLGPSIEINLPLDPNDRVTAGRSLVDEDRRLYLAHKGGLGGGRDGHMKMAEFAQRIRGFVPEPVLHADEREEHVFVIGALDEGDFLWRLASYVRECERLRAWAKKSVGWRTSGEDVGNRDMPRFSEENGSTGTGTGRPYDEIVIRRLHGRVVNALHKKLLELGVNTTNATKYAMRPDLYVPEGDGRMSVLFEVKASSDPQSWFTALGQLVVYGAHQSPPPRRLLVVPAPLKNSAFPKALKELSVTLITYDAEADPIEFFGLERF